MVQREGHVGIKRAAGGKVGNSKRSKVGGREHRLTPLGDSGGLFLIFGDATNAEETYGGGRFLSVEKPDEKGRTAIDFNRAVNPPCAFSPFATCPLPPKMNRLPIKVTAGEKVPQGMKAHDVGEGSRFPD